MTKEEQAALKQQFLEEKQQAYDAEPEVKNWIAKKRILFRIAVGYWIIHAVLSAVALHQMGAGFNLLTDVLRPLFQLFWLYVFMSPNGTWRVNVVLYLCALFNFVLNFNNYIHNIQGYLFEIIAQMPVLGIVLGMEILVPFLFLALACYLTLPKSHREWSERAEAIQKELMESFKARNSG